MVIAVRDVAQVVAGERCARLARNWLERARNGLMRPAGRGRAQAAAWRDRVPGGPGPQLEPSTPHKREDAHDFAGSTFEGADIG